jgi:superfamily II DNA/RNA helicase
MNETPQNESADEAATEPALPRFDQLGLRPEILRAVTEQGYITPTPIQAQAIPVVLAGRDLMGGAQTGTGKTAAFVLPLLQRLSHHANPSPSPARHPVRALFLTPTRELAMQVQDDLQGYAKHLPFRTLVVYGGVDIRAQIEEIRKGVEFLVATPGRLLDLVEQKTLNFQSVEATKPTACSTWALSPTSSASSTCCRKPDRACSSRPPSRTRSRSSPRACSGTR